jgi:hypothetical protein
MLSTEPDAPHRPFSPTPTTVLEYTRRIHLVLISATPHTSFRRRFHPNKCHQFTWLTSHTQRFRGLVNVPLLDNSPPIQPSSIFNRTQLFQYLRLPLVRAMDITKLPNHTGQYTNQWRKYWSRYTAAINVTAISTALRYIYHGAPFSFTHLYLA